MIRQGSPGKSERAEGYFLKLILWLAIAWILAYQALKINSWIQVPILALILERMTILILEIRIGIPVVNRRDRLLLRLVYWTSFLLYWIPGAMRLHSS